MNTSISSEKRARRTDEEDEEEEADEERTGEAAEEMAAAAAAVLFTASEALLPLPCSAEIPLFGNVRRFRFEGETRIGGRKLEADAANATSSLRRCCSSSSCLYLLGPRGEEEC